MSEPEAYAFQAPLSIVIDFKSPNAYLALQPSLELIDSLGVDVDWLPFDAPPLRSYEPVDAGAERGARHRWIRAQYWARDLERHAARQGLSLKDPYRTPDISLAGMALLWLKQRAPQSVRGYLQDCFAGLWSEDLDLEDSAALNRLIEAAGGGTGFVEHARSEGRIEWDSLQKELVAAGIFDVPSYVVGQELFLGRQHLPMVRKLLEA